MLNPTPGTALLRVSTRPRGFGVSNLRWTGFCGAGGITSPYPPVPVQRLCARAHGYTLRLIWAVIGVGYGTTLPLTSVGLERIRSDVNQMVMSGLVDMSRPPRDRRHARTYM